MISGIPNMSNETLLPVEGLLLGLIIIFLKIKVKGKDWLSQYAQFGPNL